MKFIKIASVIVFVLILLECFAYLNILTSEKDEVDVLQTIYKIEGKILPDKDIEAKKIEIIQQKRNTKIQFVVLLIFLIILLNILIYKNIKNRKHLPVK